MICINYLLFFEFTIILPFLFEDIEAKGGGFGGGYYGGGRDSIYGVNYSKGAIIGVIIGVAIIAYSLLRMIFCCDCNDDDDNDRLEETEFRNYILSWNIDKQTKLFYQVSEDNAITKNVVEQSYYRHGKRE